MDEPAIEPVANDPKKNSSFPQKTDSTKWVAILFILIILTLVFVYVYFKKEKVTQFDITKKTEIIAPSLIETRFQGRITAIRPANEATGGIHIELQSVTPESPYPTAVFEYDQALLDRLGLGEFVKTLELNNRLDIIEWTNLEQILNNGLVAVFLTRPQEPTQLPQNQYAFELIKKQINPTTKTLLQRLNYGTIESITQSTDAKTVSLTINRTASDKVTAIETFTYKTFYFDNFLTFKPGDNVIITEINDFSKNYEDSILSLDVTKQL